MTTTGRSFSWKVQELRRCGIPSICLVVRTSPVKPNANDDSVNTMNVAGNERSWYCLSRDSACARAIEVSANDGLGLSRLHRRFELGYAFRLCACVLLSHLIVIFYGDATASSRSTRAVLYQTITWLNHSTSAAC